MGTVKKTGEGFGIKQMDTAAEGLSPLAYPNTHLCASQLHLWFPLPRPLTPHPCTSVFPAEPSSSGLCPRANSWACPFGSASPTPQRKYSLPYLASAQVLSEHRYLFLLHDHRLSSPLNEWVQPSGDHHNSAPCKRKHSWRQGEALPMFFTCDSDGRSLSGNAGCCEEPWVIHVCWSRGAGFGKRVA